MSGRFWRSIAKQPGLLNPSNYFETVSPRGWNNTSVTLTDTHIVSPTLTNQFLFSYNHTNGDTAPVYPAKSLKDLGVNIYNDDKPQFHITVAGYFDTMNTGDRLSKGLRSARAVMLEKSPPRCATEGTTRPTVIGVCRCAVPW